MPSLYVDADACPVKDEIAKVAIRHQIQTIMVCNGGIRPHPHPLIALQIVASGPDEADKWIDTEIQSQDILVTNDIPLAVKAVAKGAFVLRPDGSVIDEKNSGMILASRDLMADIRSSDPFHQSKGRPFSKADRGRFSQMLDQLCRRITS